MSAALSFVLSTLIFSLTFEMVTLAAPTTPFNIARYHTDPSIRAPVISFWTLPKDNATVQPGYILIDPKDEEIDHGLGPLMYDTWGNLVWDGTKSLSPKSWRTQGSHVCDFMGDRGAAICFLERWDKFKHNVQRILNNRYEQVGIGNYFKANGFIAPDQHETATVDDGHRLLRVIYRPTEANLTDIGEDVDGLVSEGCFQEVDLEDGKETFRWCGLDDMRIKGSTHEKAGIRWDFMHINSVDKNEEGDFLVSVRYYNQIVKIAGPDAQRVHGLEPGTIIWRLGGDRSNFTFDHHEDAFNWQHDARFVSTTKNETLLTVFDNHNLHGFKFNGSLICSGKLIRANNETMKAEVVQMWPHPDRRRCDSTGSMRLQPNGNAFISWGGQPRFSEFTSNGTLLLHGTFAKPKTKKQVYNYRVIKSDWIAYPPWKPKLLAYSQQLEGTKLVSYASWDGATEVESWRFFVSQKEQGGDWIPAGTFAKQGFETKAILSEPGNATTSFNFMPWVAVEALARNGTVLSRVTNSTFVPQPSAIQYNDCDEEGCHYPDFFAYDESYRRPSVYGAMYGPMFVLACLAVVVESITYIWHSIFQ